MQIAIVIAICIAFSCSSIIYAEDTQQPVINNNTTDEPVLNNSIVSDENSTNKRIEEYAVDSANNNKDDSIELEEAGVDNTTQYQNSTNSLNINNSAKEEIKAAGTTTSKYSTTYDLQSIKDASTRVKNYIEKYHKLPSYVTISNNKITMSEFLYLLVKGTVQINSGKNTKITLKTMSAALKPSGNAKVGVLYKSAYITLAKNIIKYMDKYGRAPNYASSSLGTIQYQKLIYTMSKIVNFQKSKKYLPNYVSVPNIKIASTSSGGTSNNEIGSNKVNDAYNGEILANFLKSTKNCQVTNSQITALASSLTKGLSTQWEKSEAIFNWVRNNLNYSYYYNTKYGSVKTLELKKGNCVDHSHLLVALARAAKIQARYVHGKCVFNSGTTYGHVWAQLYVNGVWYAADAISYNNKLGVIKNWNTSSVIIKGKYAELPF